MSNAFKDIDQPRRKTLGRISPLLLPLLICLIGNNLSIRAKPARKIRITKEVYSNAEDKNGVTAITCLSQVLILFLRGKKKTSLTSNALIADRKVIISQSVQRKRIQKTSVGLSNLYIGDCS